ncbi:hypothetical protein ANRL2_02052 [Anaerolineae bacterium]|nr:hypothetical protein ANRL2_02052 [Anaerolineae bacterium]
MDKAGQSTRKMAARRRSVGLICLIVALGVAIALLVIATNPQAIGVTGVGLLALIIGVRIFSDLLTARANRLFKAEKRAVRGARGEETIGHILDALGPQFYTLHDIACPYGNIDHIVLSQSHGVFLIETKAHGGKVQVLNDRLLVNGKPPEKDFIAQATRNAYWLKEKLHQAYGLNVWITPILVFTNAFVLPTAPVKSVVIINKKYLSNELSRGRSGAAAADLWERREDVKHLLMPNLGQP